MTKKIKRAILKTNSEKEFLPLSDIVSEELFSLAGMPIVKYLVDEALEVGVEHITILGKEKKRLAEFFRNLENQEKLLKKEGNPKASELSSLKKKYQDLSFSFSDNLEEATQGEGNFALISSQELIYNQPGPLSQLMDVFRTSERPVVALKEEEVGDLKTEKIARGLYKIKKFSEEATFSLVGRSIFTPESKKYLKGESLRDFLKMMMKKGHTVYGSTIEGKRFKLRDTLSYLKANLYYSLNSNFEADLREFINNEDLL